MCPAAWALGPHRLQQGQGLQRGWGEPQWDQPPGRSTQQESQGAAGCQQLEQMSEKTALSHPVPSCPVPSCSGSDFFSPFFGKAAPDKFRLVMQTPAEPPRSLEVLLEKPLVVTDSFAPPSPAGLSALFSLVRVSRSSDSPPGRAASQFVFSSSAQGSSATALCFISF